MATKAKVADKAVEKAERKSPVRRSQSERALADFTRSQAAFERSKKRFARAEEEFAKAQEAFASALYEFSFFNEHPLVPDDMRVDLSEYDYEDEDGEQAPAEASDPSDEDEQG